jgi:hypothetical protein
MNGQASSRFVAQEIVAENHGQDGISRQPTVGKHIIV